MTNESAPNIPATPGEYLLKVTNLSAWYGAARILFDLNFEVRRGEVVAMMGRNGAGKSTTFLSVMGILERYRGSVNFLGQDITREPSYRIAQMGLGFVPEDRRIFTELTVLENLDIGRQPPRGWPDGTAISPWTPEDLFDLFPNLAERRHMPAGRMSGGEQQMLTVARTLMGNPYLVLLDEPSEGVAPVIIEQMVSLIHTLKAAGVSILLSEQNLHFARQVSDRIYMIEKGAIVYSGTMEELLADSETSNKYLSLGAL
ncbi:MAG: ABC transporter ATP-binding protein [Rhizobiaceae bacterium]|nr:ABC transporter ATP-binding protein [Rhizobiaceae bacterium]